MKIYKILFLFYFSSFFCYAGEYSCEIHVVKGIDNFKLISADQIVDVKGDFDFIAPFKNGMARFGIDGKEGFIDQMGQVVIQPREAGFYDFSDEMAVIVINQKQPTIDGKYGFIDIKGDMVIQPIFDSAQSFKDGLAPVKKGHHAGLIDRNGNFVVSPNFDAIWFIARDRYGVRVNNRYGMIDSRGNIIAEVIYEEPLTLQNNESDTPLVPVKKNGKWGYIDLSGRLTISPRFDYAYHFSEGLAVAVMENKYGFIDRYGTPIVPFNFENAGSFSDNLAYVAQGYKYGFINRHGDVVIDFQYKQVNHFSDGLARVKKAYSNNDEKWEYINTKGTTAISARFSNAKDFCAGLAEVEEDNYIGIIDTNGEYVWRSKNKIKITSKPHD